MSEIFQSRNRRTEPRYTGGTIEDHLIFLRDTFSDIAPEMTIHSNDKNNRFKVRKGWFAAVAYDLECLLKDRALDPEISADLESFIDEVCNDEFRLKPTTDIDIARANTLINKLVSNSDEDPMLWSNKKPYQINWAY